jgi:hypothetical protein
MPEALGFIPAPQELKLNKTHKWLDHLVIL